MTLRHMTNPKAAVGDVIDAAGGEGVLIETQGRPAYAMIPLDEDLIDYLIERSPAFARDCARIRDQMRQGQFHSHDEVKAMLKDLE